MFAFWCSCWPVARIQGAFDDFAERYRAHDAGDDSGSGDGGVALPDPAQVGPVRAPRIDGVRQRPIPF
jgi:hypothetical protein